MTKKLLIMLSLVLLYGSFFFGVYLIVGKALETLSPVGAGYMSSLVRPQFNVVNSSTVQNFLLPDTDLGADLGTSYLRFNNAYIGGTLTVGSCTGCGSSPGSAVSDWYFTTGLGFIAPSTTVGIAVATSSANHAGLFNVDTSGNISSSGTLKVYGSTVLAGLTVDSCTGCGAGGGASADWLKIADLDFITPTHTVGLVIATSTANPLGLFSVDTRGSVYASGTLNLSDVITLMGTSTPGNVASGTIKIYAQASQGFTRPAYMDGGNLEVILGRDNVFMVRNTSGGAMTKGQVVYVTGSTGNVPNVALAQSNTESTVSSVAVLMENVANNNFGRAMNVGILTNFDTSGFASGERLYVSPDTAGLITNIHPVYPNLDLRVGSVLVSGVSGSIQVSVAPFLDNEEDGTISNYFKVGSAGTISNLLNDSLVIASSTANSSGLFNIDQNGNISTSGTLFNMTAPEAMVSTTYLRVGSDASVSGTLFVDDISHTRASAFTIRNSAANQLLTLDTGSGGTILFNDNSRQIINSFFYLGSGTTVADSAIVGMNTQTNDNTFAITLGTGTRTLLLMENGDTGINLQTPIQTDPTLVFVGSVPSTGDDRYMRLSQGATSSSIKTSGVPFFLQNSSSTFWFAGSDPTMGTTTIMVTSTNSNVGTADTGKTSDGKCFERYVDANFVEVIQPCSEWYTATSSFR
jgi:hypothetical protein